MKKLYRLFAAIASASMLLFAAASCTDTMSELSEEIPLSRCLTPTDLVSRVHGGQYVDFSWTKTRGADTFVLEVFDEDDLKVEDVVDLKKMDESTPVRTMTVPSDQTLPVTMYLDPDEVYYARVKASDSTNAKEDSHFANFPKKIETIAIKDGLNPVLVSRTGTSITIKWTADPEVDHIRITPPRKCRMRCIICRHLRRTMRCTSRMTRRNITGASACVRLRAVRKHAWMQSTVLIVWRLSSRRSWA